MSQLRILYAARVLRAFCDGFGIIILPAYLTAIGVTPLQIGLIATAALAGSALTTLAIGLVGARHDARRLMIGGAALMVLTGLAIPSLESVMLIGLVAFCGTLNPSSSDMGFLVPLEHAAIARSASDRDRTRAFARYSLIGALGVAVGALAAGLPDHLARLGLGMDLRVMFYGYAALGLVAMLLYARLPPTPVPERHAARGGPARGRVGKLALRLSLA